MALRGRRSNNFVELWCLVASGVLDIFKKVTSAGLSSLRLEKCYIHHDISRFYWNIFVSKHENKAKFKNVDDSEVLSRDFSGLINLCKLTDLTILYSPISSKNFLILIVGSSLAPKWPKLVHFCQKFNFLLILAPVGGCWGQPMLLL